MSEKEATQAAEPKQEASGEKKKPQPKKAKVKSAAELRKESKVKWTKPRCLKQARRFNSEQEWAKGTPASYKAAKNNGWIAECLASMSNENVISLADANKRIAKERQHHGVDKSA